MRRTSSSEPGTTHSGHRAGTELAAELRARILHHLGKDRAGRSPGEERHQELVAVAKPPGLALVQIEDIAAVMEAALRD